MSYRCRLFESGFRRIRILLLGFTFANAFVLGSTVGAESGVLTGLVIAERAGSLKLVTAIASAAGEAKVEGDQAHAAASSTPIKFRRTVLDSKFRGEGATVGDFNRDGKLDIAAGPMWFSAPDWKMHSLAPELPEFDPRRYSHSFVNAVEDLNGDSWNDLIVVDFPGQQTWWFENPREAAGPWPCHLITPVTNNESPQYVDVDGDGKRDLLMGVASDPKKPDGPDRQMALLRPHDNPLEPWRIQPISAKGASGTVHFSHGLGAGDINGDQRTDVVVADGWYEAPADKEAAEWKFHPIKFGKPVAHMVVYDYDGDGDADIACSSAHARGIWWLEQTADDWVTHEIDSSVAETHAMCLADINRDGLPDLMTGNRWWSHAPKDGAHGPPAVLMWLELKRENGQPTWTPHEIDHDSGVGTQFEVADVNGDGLLDIVTSNKKGTFYFEQQKGITEPKQ